MTQENSRVQRRNFAILLAVVEITVCIFYGIFAKVDPTVTESLNQSYYPMYQDINVMMLIGFGFLMTFIKGYTFSALSYTFFINAVVVQIYILFNRFWNIVFRSDGFHYNFTINQRSFVTGSYCVASILIAFGAILGKVGPLQLLVTAIIGVFGYSLNEDIVYNQLKLYDAGGSTSIHAFGAFFGLVVSFFISRTQEGRKIGFFKTSHVNNTFAMIGTLFLWMFWPSFNAGYFPISPLQRTLIIINTIISLTASCLGAFIVITVMNKKFTMQQVIRATIAGGVIIGAPSSLITQPAAAFAIGLGGGMICCFCYFQLTDRFYKYFRIHDTCGVHNLHGIPGFLGGILSAVVIASYNAQSVPNEYQSHLPYGVESFKQFRSYTQQAAVQVAGTFMSVGIGIATGILAGLILTCIYQTKQQEFFNDKFHFSIPEESEQIQIVQKTEQMMIVKN